MRHWVARWVGAPQMCECLLVANGFSIPGRLLHCLPPAARCGCSTDPYQSPGHSPARAIARLQGRKAYTALSTKTPTRLFAERARSNPETANLNTLDELLLLGGGIPLWIIALIFMPVARADLMLHKLELYLKIQN